MDFGFSVQRDCQELAVSAVPSSAVAGKEGVGLHEYVAPRPGGTHRQPLGAIYILPVGAMVFLPPGAIANCPRTRSGYPDLPTPTP